MKDLRASLEAIVGAAHLTHRGGRASDAGSQWITQPGSAAEVAEVIALANRLPANIVPIGNQTRLPRPIAEDEQRPTIHIDSRRLCHVLHLDETSLTVHVQAGLTGVALERILVPRGLSLGDFPPQALSSTIGGLLSVRTPGKSSPRHGFLEDAVLGVSAVLADGRTIHTRVAPRRATGPDLARSLCGSEGKLGFITAAVLRLHRRPEARLLAAFDLPSFADAIAAVRLALREEAQPAAIRVYDSAEARAHLRPDLCQDGRAVLVVATAGPTDLAACDRDLIASAAAAFDGEPLPVDVAELWWRRRIGQEHDSALPVPSLQVTVPPRVHGKVYRAVCDSARELGAAARAHASRFDNDAAVMFFTFVEGSEAPPPARLSEIRAAAERAARDAGAVLLGSEATELGPYYEALKQELDPLGIMNPA